MSGGPWTEQTRTNYDDEVRRCQIIVMVNTVADRSAIYRVLMYSKSAIGRGLVQDVPHLRLRKNDRLDPGLDVRDVSRFEFTRVPFSCTFWRITKEDRVLHASPLFEIEGINPHTHSNDLLHCWHLGPEADYVGTVLTFVIKSKILAPDLPYLNVEDQQRIALLAVKSRLWRYYSKKRQEDPNFKKRGSEARRISTKHQSMLPSSFQSRFNSKLPSQSKHIRFVIPQVWDITFKMLDMKKTIWSLNNLILVPEIIFP